MMVKDVMTRHVEIITPEETIQKAAEKMKSHKISGLPVCEAGKIIGILTDHDIISRSTALGTDPTHVKAKDIMTSKVECCYMDESLKEVAKKMEEKHIHRMPVMSNNNILIGIVTVGDLASKGSRKIAVKLLEKLNMDKQ